MKISVSEEIYQLILARAKREGKKFDELVNELLSKVLWNEPGMLFRGKHFKIQPDLFGTSQPKPGEVEE